MAIKKIRYQAGDITLVGALVWNGEQAARRPLVLVSTNWLGMTETSIETASRLVGDAYIGFVADMYGDGLVCTEMSQAAAQADGLRAAPEERRRRIAAALAAMGEAAGSMGDPERVAAVGFCFGGGNVLELMRTGADIRGGICVHGDLVTNGALASAGSIKGPVLILHGAADPVAGADQRAALEAEMTAAGADWQMHLFGGVYHSFTEADANVPGVAEYNAYAARQSDLLIGRFLSETLG